MVHTQSKMTFLLHEVKELYTIAYVAPTLGNLFTSLITWWKKEASPVTKAAIVLTCIVSAAALIFFASPLIFLYLLIGTIGFTMVWKTSWWIDILGRNNWAEEYLTSGFGSGAGGTWLLYKVLGIIAIVSVVFHWTGILEKIVVSTLGGFFPGGRF